MAAPSTAPNRAVGKGPYAVIIVLLAYLLYLKYPVYISGNEGSHYYLLRAVTADRSLSLDYYPGYDAALFKGGRYSNKPPGFACAMLPFYYIFYHAVTDDFAWGLFFLQFLNSLAAALSAAVFFRIAGLFTGDEDNKALLTFALYLGTMVFFFSNSFLSHSFSVLLLLSSVYFSLLYYRDGEKPSAKALAKASAASFFAAYACFTDITNIAMAVLIYSFIGYSVLKKKRPADLIGVAAAALPVLVLWGGYNYLCFESLTGSGYQHYAPPDHIKWKGFSALRVNPLKGIYGMLFSPSRGLVFFSPFFAALPFVLFKAIRKNRLQAGLLLGLFLSVVLLFSTYVYWHGGHFVGHRHILQGLPFLCLLFALPDTELLKGKIFKILAAVSILINASVSSMWVWEINDAAWQVAEQGERHALLFGDLSAYFISGMTSPVLASGIFMALKILIAAALATAIMLFMKTYRGSRPFYAVIFLYILALPFANYYRNPSGEGGDTFAVKQKVTYLYNKGKFLGERGKLVEAEKSFREALDYDPRRDTAYLNLGLFYNIKGDSEAASACFREALKYNSSNMKAWYNLGLYFKSKGDIKEALRIWDLAVKDNPDAPESAIIKSEASAMASAMTPKTQGIEAILDDHMSSAVAYFKKGEYKKALLEYKIAYGIRKDPAILDKIKECSAAAGP